MSIRIRSIRHIASPQPPQDRWGDGTWRTTEEGAYKYGYSDGRSFLRVLQQRKVLGAFQDGEVWGSLQGPIGAIPDVDTIYIAPQGAKGVDLVATSGAVSGRVYVVATDFNRLHPRVNLAAEDACSGVMALAVWRFEPERDLPPLYRDRGGEGPEGSPGAQDLTPFFRYEGREGSPGQGYSGMAQVRGEAYVEQLLPESYSGWVGFSSGPPKAETGRRGWPG